MLPILLGAAAAALFLTGCSKDKEKDQLPAKKTPSREPRPSKFPYQKECLASSDCPPKERMAATYDYVGAVYGNNGPGRFDEYLSIEEKTFVDKTIGGFRHPKAIQGFLQLGQKKFLERNATETPHIYCSQFSSWEFIRAKSPQYGEAAAIGGPHLCGSIYGEMYVKSNLEQEVAANPEKWIFFVELSEYSDWALREGADVRKEETALFHQIAEKLEIPVHNPLVSVDSPKVLSEMVKVGVAPMEVAMALTLSMVTIGHTGNPKNAVTLNLLTKEEQNEVLYDTLAKFFITREETRLDIEDNIKTLGLNREAYFVAMKEAFQAPPGVKRGEHFQSLRDQSNQTIKLLAEASNQLSTQRVKGLLATTGKSKAFFQMGKNHLPILSGVYRNLEEVPVETLIKVRKTTDQ